MKLTGVFTFISSSERHFPARDNMPAKDVTVVNLESGDGIVHSFTTREFVEVFKLGDSVECTFNVFKKNGGYIVSLQTVDPVL